MSTCKICFIVFVSTFILFAWSFRFSSNSTIDSINISHRNHFEAFLQQIDSLISCTALHDTTEISVLQNHVKETRYAYKRIEFLFDFIHTKYAYLNINGGPLLKIDEDLKDYPPIKPNGLQTLDELVYSPEVKSHIYLIDSIAKELHKSAYNISKSYSYTFSNNTIIEAIRSGLIRVYLLGLTGFDTPGSQNAIQENIISLEVMQESFNSFEGNMHEDAAGSYHHIDSLFDVGIQRLRQSNFENLDRLLFLRDIINPLYSELLNFLQVNNYTSIQVKTHAQDYRSTNIFDENFLDKSYFQELCFEPLDKQESIELGKLLFYDPILSKDLNMSCASCHSPDKAFADKTKAVRPIHSEGLNFRNAPTLIDASFSRKLFHDLRTIDLERQVAHVVENDAEFNSSFKEIARRLEDSPDYKSLFEKAYPSLSTHSINRRTISNALAAYVNSLTSFNSVLDKYLRQEIEYYPEDAARGYNLFMGKAACGTCHFAPVFNGTVPPFYVESESEVLGVTIGLDTLHPRLDPDLGRYSNGLAWERLAHFKHAFKTPGLRNIAITDPYMHNGSFKTLEEVMEFYNHGGGAGLGLKIENQTLAAEQLNLSSEEKNDIIAFMESLTDTTGLHPGTISLPRFNNNPDWNLRKVKY